MELGADVISASGDALVLHLPVKDRSFDLSKAVCSHGLFMMAPNHWDPITRTFNRPLRLSSSSGYRSVRVQISHPCPSSPLVVSVAGSASLSPEDEEAVLDQVRRMMRMSEDNDRIIQEFHRVHADSRERGFGRVFRSPTLFEDMIKCILLCNCQWPRTLSMARALCELQPHMKHCSNAEAFHPKTPQKKEMKRKRHPKKNKVTIMSERKFVDGGAVDPENPELKTNQTTNLPEFRNLDAVAQSCHQSCQDTASLPYEAVGNFPMPEELAGCDAAFLASRCKLGYRAQRIVHLARSIADGKLHLKKLEELCKGYSESSYELVEQQLMVLSGFGPFTRANVLMCMGFYHRVPADTETVRHIKQYHGRGCSLKCVQKNIEAIYGYYAPFQFLAYWSELWRYYEEKFGTWSKMPASSYQLVTASNMKDEIPLGLKDTNLESEEQ